MVHIVSKRMNVTQYLVGGVACRESQKFNNKLKDKVVCTIKEINKSL